MNDYLPDWKSFVVSWAWVVVKKGMREMMTPPEPTSPIPLIDALDLRRWHT